MNKWCITLIFISIIFAGCSGSVPTVATLGNEYISLNEFEDSYAKSNGGWEQASKSSLEDREKYLDLLLKFRLKVKEARAQGLDKDSLLQSEIKAYRASVASSYIIEKDMVQPKIKAIYDRKKEEIRASHILLRVPTDAAAKDTVEPYEKAMKIIAQIATEPFDSLAVRYSEDESVTSNKGDLGFFSIGKLVPEFEDACYAMNAGEITRVPVRTQFGYHIIKITNRRPARGMVRISHILRRFSENLLDSLTVKDSIITIYGKLTHGMPFDSAAMLYSQDDGSSTRGGDIGSYELTQIPPQFSDLFYSMKVGAMTEPIRQPYGYHIFKLTEVKDVASFQESEKDIRTQYQSRSFNTDFQQYVAQMKKKFRLSVDSSVAQTVSTSFDSAATASDSLWADALTPELRKKTIFSYAQKIFTVNDFISFISSTDEFKQTKLIPDNVRTILSRIMEVKTLEEQTLQSTAYVAGFENLMSEYEEGILMYRIEQEAVWLKTSVNDSTLHAFYEKNKEQFRWPDRTSFAEIAVSSDSLCKVLYDRTIHGADFQELAAQYTVRPGYKEKKGLWGLHTADVNELSRVAAPLAVDSISAPFQSSYGWSIVKVLGKDSSRVKTFDEAVSELAGRCVEEVTKVRSEEWVKSLKNKYPVTIDREKLAQAFKRVAGGEAR
ncbi:MAG: peptidylprolyl isomerase [bacterium]